MFHVQNYTYTLYTEIIFMFTVRLLYLPLIGCCISHIYFSL